MKFIGLDHLSETQSGGLTLGACALAALIASAGAYAAYEFYRDDAAVSSEITEVAVVAAPALQPAPPQSASATTATGPISASPAPVPTRRADLAQAIQTELIRTGCYEGPNNGAWTASTRQAMKSFAVAVNAQLPVHEPDQILLALVQGHRQQVCLPGCAGSACLQQSAAIVPPTAGHDRKSGQVQPSHVTSGLAAVPQVGVQDDQHAQQLGNAISPVEPVPPVRTPVTAAASPNVDATASAAAAASGLATAMAMKPEPGFETREPIVPTTEAREKRTSREAAPGNKAAPKKAKRTAKKSQDFKSVSKSINKSFKSIQRSLATIFQ